MKGFQIAALACIFAVASAQITPQQNFLPVSFTVSSAPFDIVATPITPAAPYSQAAYQCNITGDSRFPPFASGTFPLTLSVPVGQRVRVIFANGNLGGTQVTQQGEPGVIVQQGGSPIVQQAGGASPIVQTVGSPVVQQRAPAAAMVVQQTPTVVQQPSFPQAPSIPNPPAVVQSPVVQQSTPAATPRATTASTPAPTTRPASPVVQQSPASPVVQQSPSSPVVQQPPSSPVVQQSPSSPVVQQPPSSPVVQQSPSSPVVQQPPSSPVVQQPPSSPVVQQPPSSPVQQSPPSGGVVQQSGRKMLQDRVPGGPNNGLVEYIALASANSVPGFFAGSTQFGVPYVEFTATEAARGQVASFRGALEVAVVVGGVPQVPFRPNPSLSPECQVNVNFRVA